MQPLWKTDWQFFKILNIESPQDPASSRLDIYSREMKTYVHTKLHIEMVIAVLFMTANKGEQLQCPSADDGETK